MYETVARADAGPATEAETGVAVTGEVYSRTSNRSSIL